MKQYELVYSNFDEMKSFIYNADIINEDNILIQVFTGVIEVEFIDKIIYEIRSVLPHSKIIGSTTAGEICNGNVYTSSTVISFTIFENVQVKTKLLISNKDEYKLGMAIAKELVEKDTKVIIILSEGLLTNSEGILKGIQAINNKVIVCGGKAADNGYLKETFVFTEEGITKNGLVVAALTGNHLNITTEYSFCWTPIGKIMTVTEAHNNRIFTIDNVKTIDIYKKYLGNEILNELPMSATEFPLIILKNGVYVARVASSCCEDGSLKFLGNVEVGDKVQFGYGDVNALGEQSLELINNLQKRPVEAIFVYSCSVRRSFLQNKINLEITPLNTIAPTFGFFTYGEFFTANNSNELLNVTMTILAVSEGGQSLNKQELTLSKNHNVTKSFFEGKDLGVIKVFTNLVNQVTKELQQANEILEEQKKKIQQMNDITKSIMDINSQMLSCGEIDTLIQGILDKALNIISGSKIGSILLMENNKLLYKAAKGYDLKLVKNIKYQLEDVYQYEMYKGDNLYDPVIINNLEKYIYHMKEDYNSWTKECIEDPYELLTCAIGIENEFMGFINIFNTCGERKFNEEDKKLLKYICNDITIVLKNAKLVKNIFHISRFDSLTEIYNRRYFGERLKKILDKAKLSNEKFVICVLDLNDLKVINDTHGHYAGDEVLRRFVSGFKRKIGKNDVFGRTGGDEFEVIFLGKDKKQVEDVIREICLEFERNPVKFYNCIKEISFAYGLSEFPKDSDSITELLRIADKRMYMKKKAMKMQKTNS